MTKRNQHFSRAAQHGTKPRQFRRDGRLNPTLNSSFICIKSVDITILLARYSILLIQFVSIMMTLQKPDVAFPDDGTRAETQHENSDHEEAEENENPMSSVDQQTMDDRTARMEEIRQFLSRRQPIHSTEEQPLDPIEWTVRKLIPIPETYYWEFKPPAAGHDDSTSSSSLPPDENWQAKLPWRLKAWHRTIGAADSLMQWTDRWIAQPVAGATGLTAPRMHYVTDHMTEEEWAAARRRLRERQQRIIQDSETGQGLVVKTQDGKAVKDAHEMAQAVEIPLEER